MSKKKPVPDTKKPKPVPKKKPDGSFETDKSGMVVFDTPGPTHTTQGTVTHRR